MLSNKKKLFLLIEQLSWFPGNQMFPTKSLKFLDVKDLTGLDTT
jgi:hypothetical protein